MKRASMKKAENPFGLSYFSCIGKTCDRENCLVRCHSLEEARKDPLIQDFTAKVKRKILVSNGISSDNTKTEPLDRCKTLEDVKKDPLVLELIAKLKTKVYAKTGKTVYWEEVLDENPKVPTLLGYTLLNELGLHMVLNCASRPEVHSVQDPATLGCKPLIKIEHYYLDSGSILNISQ